MDINSISNLATSMSQTKKADAIDVAVLKKAMDMQAENAAQLIQALPPAPSNNPPHLGQKVNTFV